MRVHAGRIPRDNSNPRSRASGDFDALHAVEQAIILTRARVRAATSIKVVAIHNPDILTRARVRAATSRASCISSADGILTRARVRAATHGSAEHTKEAIF